MRANKSQQENSQDSLLKTLINETRLSGGTYSPEFVAKIQEAVKHRTGPMSVEEAIRQGYI